MVLFLQRGIYAANFSDPEKEMIIQSFSTQDDFTQDDFMQQGEDWDMSE